LEPLVHQHQPGAVPDQYFDSVTSLGAEHKGGATVRIKAKLLLHRRGEPVETSAEVNRPGRHVDLQIGARRNHPEARTARMTPDSCSTSTAVRIAVSPITISTCTGAGLVAC